MTNYHLERKLFKCAFIIENFTGLTTGAYPYSIEKPSSSMIEVDFTSVSLNGCEFNFDNINNNPGIRMGVSTVKDIKAFMNGGNGAYLIINSQKFNNSFIYIFPKGTCDCYLMDSMVPSGLDDLSGCQIYLYTKDAQVSGYADSITYGYAIDKTGTVHSIPEFNSNTLRQ